MASLVIQTSFIGDAILTTPLIAALSQRGPVDVVVTPTTLPLLANNPHIRHAITYDKRGEHSGPLGLFTISRRLRESGPYAAAYLAQGSLRSALLARMAGVSDSVGFDTSAGRRLYSRVVRYDETAHHAERLMRLAGMEPQAELVRPRLYPGTGERARVDELLRTHGWSGEPLVALAPGSIWPTKRWPYYPELAARVDERFRVVVVGGAADAPLAAAIAEQTPSTMDATGQLSLLESAELIGRCAALVSNDSAPVHMASAMNTPTLAIFGPTVPAFGFGPLANANDAAGHDSLACRPCDRHGPRRCPLGHWKCMRELDVEEVHRRLLQLLQSD